MEFVSVISMQTGRVKCSVLIVETEKLDFLCLHKPEVPRCCCSQEVTGNSRGGAEQGR